MTDVVSPDVRSRMMRGIRGKDTSPELLVRHALFKRGFRYRLHDKRLPGRPDLVLRKHNAVIFVHGCFWHMHNCSFFKWPQTRHEWWQEKLLKNHARDERHVAELRNQGFRVATVWECALRRRGSIDKIADSLAEFLQSDQEEGEWRE